MHNMYTYIYIYICMIGSRRVENKGATLDTRTPCGHRCTDIFLVVLNVCAMFVSCMVARCKQVTATTKS